MSAVANTLPEADAFVAHEKQRWDQVITAGKISANWTSHGPRQRLGRGPGLFFLEHRFS